MRQSRALLTKKSRRLIISSKNINKFSNKKRNKDASIKIKTNVKIINPILTLNANSVLNHIVTVVKVLVPGAEQPYATIVQFMRKIMFKN